MENIVEGAVKAVEAEAVKAVEAELPAVEAEVEKAAALDVKAICDDAIAHLQALLDKIQGSPDGKGLRSTLNFAIGRFVAEKDQMWQG